MAVDLRPCHIFPFFVSPNFLYERYNIGYCWLWCPVMLGSVLRFNFYFYDKFNLGLDFNLTRLTQNFL